MSSSDNEITNIPERLVPSDGLNNSELSQKTDESNEVIADLENMPAEMSRWIAMFMSQQSSGISRPNPLFEKFTDAHVDKYLDYLQRDDDNAHKLKSTNRYFHALYVILFIVSLGLLIYFLTPNNPNLLDKLIDIVVYLAAGLAGGYGVKSYLDDKE